MWVRKPWIYRDTNNPIKYNPPLLYIYKYGFKHIDTVVIKKLIRYVVTIIYCPALFLFHAILSPLFLPHVLVWNKYTFINIFIIIQYIYIIFILVSS